MVSPASLLAKLETLTRRKMIYRALRIFPEQMMKAAFGAELSAQEDTELH